MTKRIPLSFGPSEVSVEKRADGSLIVRTLARTCRLIRAR